MALAKYGRIIELINVKMGLHISRSNRADKVKMMFTQC